MADISEAMVEAVAIAITNARLPDGCRVEDYLPPLNEADCKEWGISWPTYAYDRRRDVRDDQIELFSKALARAALEAVAALSAAPASAQMDELSRLREANRKLHRRVQVAERFQAAVGGQAEDLWRFYKSICPNKDMEYWAASMYRAVCHRLTVSRAEVYALRESLPTAGGETL